MELVFLFLMLALMWAFVIRPQQRKVKEHRAFVASLSVGDEVVTTSGVYGTITDLSQDRVRLEIAPDVEITMARLAIGHRPHEADPVSSDNTPDSALDRVDEVDADNGADSSSSPDDTSE